MGDSPVCGEFIVVRISPLSEVALCLWELDILWHSIRKLPAMKKYILSVLGIFVAMAFIASCQQEGTTVTEEPASGPHSYMNRPAPSPKH